jgi:hypothetical protein
MGASWICMTVMDWLWLFHPMQKFLAVSRVAALVDDGANPDSLFWKIDYMHAQLPTWLLEPDQVKRKKFSYVNVANGSTINGEATTGAAGVGGRATCMFIDEFSRIPEAAELLASTADTTGCRMFNFTYSDNANAAYKLGQRTDVQKLRMHWSDHPHKNKGLYQYSAEKGRVEIKGVNAGPLNTDSMAAGPLTVKPKGKVDVGLAFMRVDPSDELARVRPLAGRDLRGGEEK